MTDEITIKLDNLSSPDALYHRYPTQVNPQPVYVEMSNSGVVTADWAGDLSTPMPVWNGLTRRWRVTSLIDATKLRGIIERDLAGLLERVHAGHSVEWDGRNHVGKLDADAEEASDQIEQILIDLAGDESVLLEVWDAGDWLSTAHLLDVWPSGSLDDAEAENLRIAHANGITLSGSMKKALLDMAVHLVEDREPGLTEDHLAALIEFDRITEQAAAEYREEK